MNDEQKYDRVGRYLDGENIRLSADELELANEIDSDKRQLAGALDADALPDSNVVQHAQNQALAALTGRKKRNLIINIGSLAAAAVLVFALAIWPIFKNHSIPLPVNDGGEFSAWASEIDPDPTDMIAIMSLISNDQEVEQEAVAAELSLDLDLEM